jgi:hypothetical protein
MSTYKVVACPICGKALIIGYDLPKDTITGSCFCFNEKRNSVLTALREQGEDIRPSLFEPKKRGNKR